MMHFLVETTHISVKTGYQHMAAWYQQSTNMSLENLSIILF